MDRPPLTPTEFASAVTAITSAFGDPTRRAIYLFARESDRGVTAAEVAERFELHPNVARHHLDKLTGGGYLEVAVGRAGKAGAGRPSKHYEVTAKDVALEFPVHHDDLLVTLLGRALALLPAEQAEAMAEEVGAEYGKVMAHSLGDRDEHEQSFRDALHAVAQALTAHGFAAHAEKHRNSLRIVAEHCPFGDAAIENPVICAVDRGMVKGMLGVLYGDTSATLESSLPMGDRICVTAVEASSDMASRRRLTLGIALGAVVALPALAWVAFGYFGVHKLWVDEDVDEQLTTFVDETTPAPDASAAVDDTAPGTTLEPVEPAAVRLATGMFTGVEGHRVEGTANLIAQPDGSHVLQFPDLDADNGPDLVVWLSVGGSSDDIVELGELKGNVGNEEYVIPADVDVSRFDTAVIWCRRFSVGFGEAPLAPV